MIFLKAFFKHRILGIIIGLILLVASGLFVWFLSLSGMVPTKYLLIGFAVLFALAVGITFLCINIKKTARLIVGCILAAVILAVQCYVVDFVGTGTKTLEKITDVKTEYAVVSVYVRADDPSEDFSELKGYKFGILKNIDRRITDGALKNISSILGEELAIIEYETIDELAEALLNTKEVDAIVINVSFIDILVEIEGFENASENMREIYESEIEATFEVPVSKPSSSGGGGSYAEGPLDIGTYVAPNPSVKMPEHVFSVYLSGIDCYGSVTRRSRSDVNIVAFFNTKTHEILLISAPRDFYVATPVSSGAPDKLTNAGIYGAKVSRGALEMLYDTEINYEFKVNFTGFEKIIDSLGGITVYSKYNFKGENGGDFVKGYNEVNGKLALSFARERHSFASGDRQRGKNQMEVIKGVIDKATSIAMLTNYKKILESVAESMETTVPLEKITELINEQLSSGAKWNVSTYSVDGTGASKKPFSQKGKSYVMVPKQSTIDKAKSLIGQILNDETPTP